MKELSIEEKAKRYDEAIERANKWYNAPNVDKIPTFGNRVIEEIFPELKESEGERIRKAIIKYFKTGTEYVSFSGFSKGEIINWLEKQNQNLEKLKLEKGKWYFCIEDYHPRADCTDFYQGEKYRCEKDGVMGVWRIKNPEKYFRECETPTYAGSDAVRIQSIIQVLEYARSLSAYNQFGKDDITKDIAWLENTQYAIDHAKREEFQLGYKAGIEKQGEQKPDDNKESTMQSYITPNQKFFQWIYDRLIYVHNENPNVDYMLSLKERIKDM